MDREGAGHGRSTRCGRSAGEVIPLYGIDAQKQGPLGIAHNAGYPSRIMNLGLRKMQKIVAAVDIAGRRGGNGA